MDIYKKLKKYTAGQKEREKREIPRLPTILQALSAENSLQPKILLGVVLADKYATWL